MNFSLFQFHEISQEESSSNYIQKQIPFFKKNSYSCENQVDDQHEQHQLINFFQDQTTQSRNNPIIKKISKQKKQKSNPTRDYKKNICRNIVRHAVKSMLSSKPSKQYLQNLIPDNDQYIDFAHYYNKTLDTITGYRVLKQHLLFQYNEDENTIQRKIIFRKYLTWFLKERATINILQGEVTNQKEYIKYKNEILLYYLQQPESWQSNIPLWKKTIPPNSKIRTIILHKVKFK